MLRISRGADLLVIFALDVMFNVRPLTLNSCSIDRTLPQGHALFFNGLLLLRVDRCSIVLGFSLVSVLAPIE